MTHFHLSTSFTGFCYKLNIINRRSRHNKFNKKNDLFYLQIYCQSAKNRQYVKYWSDKTKELRHKLQEILTIFNGRVALSGAACAIAAVH